MAGIGNNDTGADKTGTVKMLGKDLETIRETEARVKGILTAMRGRNDLTAMGSQDKSERQKWANGIGNAMASRKRPIL